MYVPLPGPELVESDEFPVKLVAVADVEVGVPEAWTVIVVS
jgi:hypothetical protein